MRTVLKLAFRLAFSADPRQRWRQASVVVTTCVATLLVLLGVGLVGAAQDAEAVIHDRSPVWAPDPETAPLQISIRGVGVEDEQYPVVWLNPAPGHETDAAIVPPGLDRLPAPGEGVLSPGLVAAGYTAADFGLASSDAGSGPEGQIGLDGVISLTDGWIYARPAQDRTLGSGGALLGFTGYRGGGDRASLETVPDIPSTQDTIFLALGFLAGPGLVLGLGGSRALSGVRIERSRILFRLGLPTRRIRAMLALETVALALPGVALGVLCWIPLSRVQALPLTGTTLLPGALDVPAPAVAAAAAVVTAAAALAGAIANPGRQSYRRRTVRDWHIVPLGISLAMMGISALPLVMRSGAHVRPGLLFGGLILMFATLPLSMPVLAARIGRLLARSARPAPWLAGRRLSASPWNLARPASVVGLLVFITGSAFALYDNTQQGEPEQLVGSAFTGYDINWRDGRPGDFAWLSQTLAPALVLPAQWDDDGTELVGFTSCQEAAPLAEAFDLATACDGEGFSAEFAERVRANLRIEVSLADEIQPVEEVAYILDLDTANPMTVREVMAATAGRLPAVNIAMTSRQTFVPITVGWIIAGWAAATLVLIAAIVREIGDRALAAMSSDDRLVRLGLDGTEVRAVERWSLLTPVLIAVPIGYAGAVAFAIMGYDIGYTGRSLGAITLVAAFAFTLALVTMAATFGMHRRISKRAA